MKIMDKLSTYAALIGVVGAIGGGFYTWGQFNSRLDAIEKKPVVNLTSLKQKDKELTQQFDDVLLYANEYKVDLIDRIAKVEEKIKEVPKENFLPNEIKDLSYSDLDITLVSNRGYLKNLHIAQLINYAENRQFHQSHCKW